MVARIAFTGLAVAIALVVSARAQIVRVPSAPMPPFDVLGKSIEQLQQAMQAGQITSRQLVDLYLARIEAYDKQGPSLNAIAILNPMARDAAGSLDAERTARGPRGPLHGIPVLLKDNYETVEMPTSAGSIALAAFHPRRDAFQVQRLKAAGAVILGKTNMHEFASGITTVGTSFGRSKNPFDLDRNPGGSSGGTGAAIAATFAAAGMGSDTCGSIRIPASHNNLVGLRGTQGLSSRSGMVPLSSTQDIGGPIARTIADLAIMLDATVGPDPADATTSVSAGKIPASYRSGLRADSGKGARLGVVRSLFGTAAEDQEVSTIVNRALDTLKKAGIETADVAIPGLEDLLRDSSMINSDFKFDLADYLAAAENAPVRSLGEILERGLFHTALENQFRTRNEPERRETDVSRRARIKRVAIRNAVEAVLAEHRLNALVYPTLRRKPSRLGDAQTGSNCQLSAHSGLPALSVPAGFSEDGVPVGLDLLGSAFAEQELLSLGLAVESTLNVRRQPFSTPALVAGRRPPPKKADLTFQVNASSVQPSPFRAVLSLTFDESTSRLDYSLNISPAARHQLSAVWMHAGTAEKPGAARHQLFASGLSTSGVVVLSAADRRDLMNGSVLVRFYLHSGRGSAADVPLSFR
jgi:Asp-tRNA(Asn)/Glu-tRNA(Gln) amidotransferase A subunit family amidase